LQNIEQAVWLNMPLTAVGHNGYRNNTQAQFERTRATFSPWVKPQNPTETVPYRLGKGQIAEVKFLNKRGYKYKIYSEFSDSSVGDPANFGQNFAKIFDPSTIALITPVCWRPSTNFPLVDPLMPQAIEKWFL
jgi:hypothetical protein